MPKTKIPAEYISDNPSLSGTDSVKVPAGTTAQRGTGVAGKFRFNTTLNKFEGCIKTKLTRNACTTLCG